MPSLTLLDRLIPAYRAKALTRALENETALKNSGYLTKQEFDDLKDKMVKAYRRVGRTSAPVIHADEYATPAFLADGEYKNQGVTKNSGGTLSPEREVYARSTYGYESLPEAEKYGVVPMDEISSLIDETRKKRYHMLPEYQYGHYRIHLKPEVKRRATINPFDSSRQWPMNIKNFPDAPHRTFFPVPYETENPEDYVGAMMDAPNYCLMNFWESVDMPQDARARLLRERNLSTLYLLQGNDPMAYVESHVHGPVMAEDVDFIEMPKKKWDRPYVPKKTGMSEKENLRRWADRYNIKLLDSEDYTPEYIPRE